MEEFWNKCLEVLKAPRTWVSIAVFLVGLIIWVTLRIVERQVKKKSKKKISTQIKLFNNVFKYVLLLIVVIVILEINGVNVSSLVAGLGIVTAIVGFALQDFLKDVIMGINIIWDTYFKVGDVIHYEGEYWEVTDMSIKATKLRNIDNDSIYTVGNRNISEIEVVSGFQHIVIPGDYRFSHKKMVEVCEELTRRLALNEMITKSEFLGTDSFEESQVCYMVRVYANPLLRDEVRRFTLGLIQDVFEEYGVDVPFNQIDVHFDEKKKKPKKENEE